MFCWSNYGDPVVGMFFFVLFWFFIFFLGFALLGGRHYHRHSDAEKILAERLAKGEITKEEYEQNLSVLRK